MGAQSFVTSHYGDTAREAFKAGRDNALYENGHNGYTGSLAEKHDFVVLPKLEGKTPQESAWQYIDDCDPRIDDKWGPAGCIESFDEQYKLKQWVFFGWASA